MGLGRREFIKLSTLALAGLSVDPLKAVAVNNNYYVNKKLGIICEKPNEWDFVSIADYGRLLDEQIFPNEVESNKKEIFEEMGWSAVIMTKHLQDTPENKGKFSPTIMVDVKHKSDLGFDYKSIREFIDHSSDWTKTILRDFQQTSLNGPILISGYSAYVLESTYLLEHIELKQPLKTNLKVVFIEHNNFYYIFNMHDTDTANEQLTFNKFIETIRLI